MAEIDFQTSAHAKCILLGEHAVLRGSPALVLPIHKKVIRLSFKNSNIPVEVVNHSEQELLSKLFLDAFRFGLQLLNLDFSRMTGTFICESNIPIGAGIGFSSALCVVISRWLIWKNWVKEKDLFEFARSLENLFHGKSSGIDIVGVMSEGLIYFAKPGEMHEVQAIWQPNLYLSYSGSAKNTKESISKVSHLMESNPELAILLDKTMEESVLMAEKALKMNREEGLGLLVSAIEQARNCFEKWNLISPQMQQHLSQIRHMGALAAKPTGAGGGGYMISLWEKTPPINSGFEPL